MLAAVPEAQTRRARLSFPPLRPRALGAVWRAQGHTEEVAEPCLMPRSSAPAQKGFAREPAVDSTLRGAGGTTRRSRVSHGTLFRLALAAGAVRMASSVGEMESFALKEFACLLQRALAGIA